MIVARMAEQQAAEAAPRPAPRLLNARPQPRVLLLGDLADDVTAEVERLAGYVEHVTVGVPSQAAVTRWLDWDAVILGPSYPRPKPALTPAPPTGMVSVVSQIVDQLPDFVEMPSAGARGDHHLGLDIPAAVPLIVFTGDRTGSGVIDRGLAVQMEIRPCHTLRPPEPINDDPTFEELARLSAGLAATVPRRRRAWHLWHAQGLPFAPLIVDDDAHPLAAAYIRAGADATPALYSFVIPYDAPDHPRWITAILNLWARTHPATFGSLNDWSAQTEWHTTDEAASHRAAHDHRAERKRLLAAHDARQAELDAACTGATAAAVSGWRRLLTDDGDTLVDAVTAALKTLGFNVVDVDARRRAAGAPDRVHDLDVTDPDAPNWIAIGEVKGYTKGASVNDLTTFSGRMAKRFILEHRRPPSRMWFVTNVQRNTMPGGRDPAFHSNPGDVAVFAADDGAVIDTRSLFRLVRALEHADDATKATVRKVLRDRIGRWPLDENAATPDAERDGQDPA